MSAFSTATLCFLFADQIDGFVPFPTNPHMTEADAPQAGGFLRGWWALTSLEITIVRLRDLEILDLTPASRADGVMPGPVVGVRAVASKPRHLPPLDDEIAGRLLRDTDVLNAMAAVGPKWVRRGFRGWLPPARDEAVRAGLGKRLGHGPLRRLWNGGDAHAWDREAINRHWEEFQSVHEGWRRFRAGDPELAQLLTLDIDRGTTQAMGDDPSP